MKKIFQLYWSPTYLMMVLLCIAPQCVHAQVENQLLQLQYLDSLEIDNETSFVRNNITITNIFQHELRFVVHIGMPLGYNLISRNDVSVQLAPGEVYILPVTLSKGRTAQAGTQIANVLIDFNNVFPPLKYGFNIRCKKITELRVLQIKKDYVITKEDRHVILELKIKNIGNSTDNFHIRYSNKFFQIDKTTKMSLNALADTLVRFEYTIPPGFVRDMETQYIVASIYNDSSSMSFSFVLSKIKNSNTGYSSAYNTFPLTVETGMIASKNELSYYWGVNGAILLNSNNSVSFNYRSKQYGVVGVQEDIFSVFYKHRKWEFSVGQMANGRNFTANGLGAQVTYRKNEVEGITVMGINTTIQGVPAKKNLINANATYAIGSMLWSGLLEGNRDPVYHTNSYVFANSLKVLRTLHTTFDLALGAGYEQYHYIKEDNAHPSASYGYNFAYVDNKWNLASNALVYGNAFPGIYKGWRSYNEYALYQLSNTILAGVYYSYNYTKQSYFLDSVYYDNQFVYNITNYGIKLGWSPKAFTTSISLGESKSTGTSGTSSVPRYHSATFSYAMPVTKFLRFSTSSIFEYDQAYGDAKNVIFYATNGSVLTKYGGFNFYVTHMPSATINSELSSTTNFKNSISYSPFLYINLFHQRVTGRIQYSYYRISDGLKAPNETQLLIGNISYKNVKRGLLFQANCNYTLKSVDGGYNYVSMGLSKSFNVPLLNSRKHFDLTLTAYEDINGNGVRDKGDSTVESVQAFIGGHVFLSDKNGTILYKNIDKGNYNVDFHNMKNAKGLIPTLGFKQAVVVNGQTHMDIPFTKGKIVKGDITITLDTLSYNTFSVGQLKVLATDSLGYVYATFTDDAGHFQINLPAGNYIVSLNPEAFDDNIKPVQMAYQVNLLDNASQSVYFHIKQKARKITRIKADVN
jgi:hypothetical protein